MNQFAPWQWPSDHDSERETKWFWHEWNGQSTKWRALFLSDADQHSVSMWIARDGSDDLFCLCDPTENVLPFRALITPRSWQIRWTCFAAFSDSRIGRLYFLNASGHLRGMGEVATSAVLVRADGCATWLKFFDPLAWLSGGEQSTFRLFADAGVAEFMTRSALQIWEIVQQALADAESDARFARDWMMLTDEQRKDLVLNWPRAQRHALGHEVQELLRCVLLCHCPHGEPDVTWSLYVPDPADIVFFPNEMHNERPTPAAIRLAVECIWRHYAPFNTDILHHQCVLDYKQTFHALWAEVLTPTSHERLEAELRWREWLEQHGE